MARVCVGLSGGVDSAVSAALLLRAGHEVTGVFIKIWQPEFIECSWREDRLDAMRVAATLGIRFKEVDLSEEYRRKVVARMVSAYEHGITPNPDVLCNSEIKFGVFMKWALENGAAYVATGHYARTKNGALWRGLDKNKDQSYFLHGLTKPVLERTLFPVGELPKSEVRVRARAFSLPVADKPDSQGLCFVGDITLPEFLGRYVSLAQGIVRDVSGQEIGVHDGALLYTKGQRHGFQLKHSSDNDTPHFVIATDIGRNEITVSPDRKRAESEMAHVERMQWIDHAPTLPSRLYVQTRYREEPKEADVCATERGVSIRLLRPGILSLGQSLVVYDGDLCLGGGPISSTE